MLVVELNGWILECDVEATRRAYAQIASGDPEVCGCLFCRNFAASRSGIYPASARRLYSQLGISVELEAEVYELGPTTSGGRLYGGWHHFVGRVAHDPGHVMELSSSFELKFRPGRDLAAPAFGEASLVQVEFHAVVPWVLPELPEDEVGTQT